MVGDTPYDVEAAQNAGVRIIAVRCGGWSDGELQGASRFTTILPISLRITTRRSVSILSDDLPVDLKVAIEVGHWRAAS